jgi:hypothetical protein
MKAAWINSLNALRGSRSDERRDLKRPTMLGVVLVVLVTSTPAICGYITSTSVSGMGELCNQNDPNTCNTFTISATGSYSSPDGTSVLRVDDSGTSANAAHGSLSANAEISLNGSTLLVPVHGPLNAAVTVTAQSSELWTIFTGLGGGFVDISAAATLGEFDSCSQSTATLQNVSAHVPYPQRLFTSLDTGPQPFGDGVPFPVTASVFATAGAFQPSDSQDQNSASASLNQFNIVVTDRQMHVLTNYTLIVSDIPEPRTITLVSVGAAMLILLFRRRRDRSGVS